MQGTKAQQSTRRIRVEECPTREVLRQIGDKWSVLVIVLLRDGPCRFNQLRREIEGISQRMLTLTLRGLERDGLVRRTVTPTAPPRVDYALTGTGRTLLGVLQGLMDWAETHRPSIQAARARFDRAAPTHE
ncbi:MAG: winged helix-turn-helix transcriptional regulator [Terriglobales bacterium]